MTDRNPLLDPLRALVEEWQRRGVSTDYVPAARDVWMQAAQELRATYIGGPYGQSEGSAPAPPSTPPDDDLNATMDALDAHDFGGAARLLLGAGLWISDPANANRIGPYLSRWQSLVGRFLSMT